MNRILRKSILFVLMFSMLGFVFLKKEQPIQVKFNDEFLPSSAGVMVKDGDVFMSYRLVGKYFGARTDGRRSFKNQNGECTISQGDLRIEMKGEVAEAKVNGKTVELKTAPFVEDFG